MRALSITITLVLTLALASDGARSLRAQAGAEPEIRLVLLIAVDQFRYDYLTRFRSEYTAGLAQLLTRGADFTNATLDHYPTVTAVGHSTMLSGATPSVSGIIGNDWFDRAVGASVTSVSDRDATLVGGTGPGASPRRLLVSTVGDQLKSASRAPAGTDKVPKVLGMALKDRSAILPVGHMADAAYWLDTTSGAFVTSTYYRPELPAWVASFNGRKPADAFLGKTWEFLDATAGPGHALPPQPGQAYYTAVFGSPFGNDLLESFASAALENEHLGQRGVTDLLSVSFSSNDSVGHTYGPDSPEVRDVSVRTDRVIGRLLARVDQLVGLDHAIVVLTADHGVAPMPEVQIARKMPGGRVKGEEVFGPIEAALAARYGPGKWIVATAGSSPYLNHALIAEKQLDPVEVRRVAAAAAMTAPHVARVYTRDQIIGGGLPRDTIGRRLERSYSLQRSGDLEIILDAFWIRSASGTTHGTPYSYDAHIPLVFMGPGIRAGAYHFPVVLNDLAPTLATLLSIETPSGSAGRVLDEMLTSGPAGPSSAGRPNERSRSGLR
jgi:predicted AlkP superfamily pyrophosphatase or phosphodiesterase